MSQDHVDQAILNPMIRLFPPPRHLRQDEDSLDAALATYRRALARFDRPVLDLAWQQVVAENPVWCWPKLSDLVRAAERAQRSANPITPTVDWADQAVKLADCYTRRFMQTTQTAKRARESGYETSLKRYVWEAAYVQSQMICGRDGIAYNHSALFPERPRNINAERDWFAKARETVIGGSIRVTVPQSLVERWTTEAGCQSRER